MKPHDEIHPLTSGPVNLGMLAPGSLQLIEQAEIGYEKLQNEVFWPSMAAKYLPTYVQSSDVDHYP